MRNAGGALPARHILGNYELFEEIGRGGMGIVYRALDLSLDRIVAVKILRDDLRAHQSIVTRFSREAQAAARLDHPNIVQIFSVGAVDRTPYIAMEFVDALPLSAVMQREHRLDWKPALEIARQIAAALACAHDSHVVHRDVKPPNILLDDHHRAYVTDFGIAKILTLDDNLTVDGTRLGTPHYMAPERCKNGELTASSDLYSLGVLMFQMLTGRLPYEASTPVAMVQRIVSEPPARVRTYVPDIPEDVERLAAWLMEMNPKHRPESGHAVCDAIDRVLAGHPLDVSEPRTLVALEDFRKHLAADTQSNKTTASDAKRSTRRLRRGIVIAGCTALAAICAGAVLRSFQPTAPMAATADPAAWFAAADVASFGDEGENVTMAELHLNGYSVLSVTPAGVDGSVAALLEQTGPGGRRVLCSISPATKMASIRFVAAPQDHIEVLASAGGLGGSLFDGYGIVRAASGMSLVSLRDFSSPISLSGAVGIGPVAGMHPSGAQWTAAIMDATGNSYLAAYTFATGHIDSRPIVPAGPRVTHIQYSRDGQYIAYVREAGAGTFALRVVAATGTDVEPAPLREGRISISPGAFNADGSAILVSTERSGGQPMSEVVSTRDGSITIEITDALRAAWAASGNVVFSASDAKGAVQLWCESTATAGPRKQLTFIDGGTDRSVIVSPDGQWATTFAANSPTPRIVFARLAQ